MAECNYITPCGWCEKWDKKCDSKIENNEKTVEQDKEKCYFYDRGDCTGTKDKDKCDLTYNGIFHCEKYRDK